MKAKLNSTGSQQFKLPDIKNSEELISFQLIKKSSKELNRDISNSLDKTPPICKVLDDATNSNSSNEEFEVRS